MVVPLLWGLLGVLAVAISRATGAGVFGWVGYLMLAALGLGQAMTALAARGLRASRWVSADRMAFGEKVRVEVEVENDSSFPAAWVAAAESLPVGLAIRGLRGRVGPMAGRSKFRFSYALEGSRRGYYRLGPVSLRTGDLFGLAEREKPAAGVSAVTVFPRVTAIEHARLSSRRPAPEVRARPRAFEDPSQVVGVRPYQSGDGWRRVHWRATAHTGELQSKLYEVSAQVAAMLVVNLRRTDYAGPSAEVEGWVELAMTCAASLANHLLERRQPVGLMCVGYDPATGEDGPQRVPFGRGREQLTALLSVLGRMELGEGEPLGVVLRREQVQMPWGALVIVITPRIVGPALPALLSLKTAGFAAHVVLVGGAATAATRVPLTVAGIPTSRIRTQEEIGGLGLWA